MTAVNGSFEIRAENDTVNSEKVTYSDGIANADELIVRLVKDYVTYALDGDANFGTITVADTTLTAVYEYGSTTTVTLSILVPSVGAITGTYTETGTNTGSGPITFVGTTGTYSDTSGDSFTVEVTSPNFTVTNNTDGWVMDSSTGKVTSV